MIAAGDPMHSGWKDVDTAMCVPDVSTQAPDQDKNPQWGRDIGVSCCSTTHFGVSTGTRKFGHSFSCFQAKSYDTAETICQEHGMRLCNLGEMLGQATKGTGCNHDGRYNWVSDQCEAFQYTSTQNFNGQSVEIGWIKYSSCTEGPNNPLTYNPDYSADELKELTKLAVTVKILPSTDIPGKSETADYALTANLCSNPIFALNRGFMMSYSVGSDWKVSGTADTDNWIGVKAGTLMSSYANCRGNVVGSDPLKLEDGNVYWACGNFAGLHIRSDSCWFDWETLTGHDITVWMGFTKDLDQICVEHADGTYGLSEGSSHMIAAGDPMHSGWKDVDTAMCVPDVSTQAPDQDKNPQWGRDIGVSCCSTTHFGVSTGTRKFGHSFSCFQAKSYDTAETICQEHGMRLCNLGEMLGQATKGTGCNHDGRYNWVSHQCGESPSIRMLTAAKDTISKPVSFRASTGEILYAWHLAALSDNVDSEWASFVAGPGHDVVIYVIDDTFDWGHPEFAHLSSEVKQTPLRDNGGSPSRHHGTAVLSLMVGTNTGVVDKPYRVKVCSACHGDDCDGGSAKNCLELIRNDLRDNEGGKKAVINWSMEVQKFPCLSHGNDGDNVLLELKNMGAITVVAAGNDGASTCDTWPSCRADRVIPVGASTFEQKRWESSNHGDCVKVWGPGAKIVTAAVEGTTDLAYGHAVVSGTSYAAPLIAGAVVNMLRVYPHYTFDAVLKLLVSKGGNLRECATSEGTAFTTETTAYGAGRRLQFEWVSSIPKAVLNYFLVLHGSYWDDEFQVWQMRVVLNEPISLNEAISSTPLFCAAHPTLRTFSMSSADMLYLSASSPTDSSMDNHYGSYEWTTSDEEDSSFGSFIPMVLGAACGAFMVAIAVAFVVVMRRWNAAKTTELELNDVVHVPDESVMSADGKETGMSA